MPEIPALGRLKQENYFMYEASLDDIIPGQSML